MLTFNTGKSVFASIEAIAATASKLEKDALMKAAGSSSTLFLKAVSYCYDPFKNYGIAHAPDKTPGIAPSSNTLEEPATWKVLDDLVSRALSGNAARTKVQNMVDLLDDASSEVFRRIINKDMRAGFSEGTINRAFKGTIPEFPYMRCSLPAKSNMAKWDWSVGIIVQEKADGMFANVNIDVKGYLWVTSRAGSLFPVNCLGIEGDMVKVLEHGYQTHGEFTVYQDDVLLDRANGNGVMNSLLSGGLLEANQRVVFDAWDQIPLSAVVPKGKWALSYRKRLAMLAGQGIAAKRAGITSVRLIPTKVVKSKAEATALYREYLLKGKEGVVCKHPDATWADNTSKDQVKLKLEAVVDLKIKAVVPGKKGGKNDGKAGSLTCETADGLLQVDVTVKNDAMRARVDANPTDWIDRIIAVCANCILEPSDSNDLNSLFLPRMVEADYRTDKTVADDLQQVRDQFDAAMEAA